MFSVKLLCLFLALNFCSSTNTVLAIPTLQLINNTNSSCVELICSLRDLSPQQVNFTWTNATQLLYCDETSNMKSTLTLCKPNWTGGETLTCQANYSHNHILSETITLPHSSDAAGQIITAGIFFGLLVGTALIFKFFHGRHTPRRRQSTRDGVVSSKLVSPSQVSSINSTN